MTKEAQARISVHAHPGARRSEITGQVEGVWHIKVAAPPTEGKANRELIDFLGEVLKTARAGIHIVSGHTARRKLIAIDGLSQEEVDRRLVSCQANS